MSVQLPDGVRELFDRKTFSTVATLLPDGRAHMSIVWTATDGDQIVFYTTDARQKAANMRRDPRVTLLTYAWEDPYQYVEVRGTAEVDHSGGNELLDRLTLKYIGVDEFPFGRPSAPALVVRVTPEKVNWMRRDRDPALLRNRPAAEAQ